MVRLLQKNHVFTIRLTSTKKSSKKVVNSWISNSNKSYTKFIKNKIENDLTLPNSQNWFARELIGEASGTPNDSALDPNSFHRAICPVLIIGQIFGLLPVSGISSKNSKSLRFDWRTFKVLYVTIINVATTIMALISIYYMLKMMGTLDDKAAISAIFFQKLAHSWPNLVQKWTKFELNMWEYEKTHLARDFRIMSGVILGLSFFEHALSVYINMPTMNEKGIYNDSFWNYLKEYCINSHPFIINITSYNLFVAFFIVIISNTATFAWNFQDLFIILISYALTMRLKMLNKRLKISHEKNTLRRDDWRKQRELYGEFSSLVKYVDIKMSVLIALSFLNNLYFICFRLLLGVGTEATSTFLLLNNYGGFLFMVLRAVFVTLMCGELQIYSKSALTTVYSCPSELFTIETERLSNQLNSDYICLTALGFVFVTRGFLLSVAGMVATYEIVLLQFDDKLDKQDVFSPTFK
ncbi:gustatory receptor for sugar taste 64a-like [Chrysoperla carnea]|uniref:gustatory receptor for sugar taste 64a-like n=1 Tax=Chrysoperla carnea TaxID=189513 RepID=UPI001D07144B|nr:gustatory receptor for sugar taste 64a-like [Chrysoperla carnea]